MFIKFIKKLYDYVIFFFKVSLIVLSNDFLLFLIILSMLFYSFISVVLQKHGVFFCTNYFGVILLFKYYLPFQILCFATGLCLIAYFLFLLGFFMLSIIIFLQICIVRVSEKFDYFKAKKGFELYLPFIFCYGSIFPYIFYWLGKILPFICPLLIIFSVIYFFYGFFFAKFSSMHFNIYLNTYNCLVPAVCFFLSLMFAVALAPTSCAEEPRFDLLILMKSEMDDGLSRGKLRVDLNPPIVVDDKFSIVKKTAEFPKDFKLKVVGECDYNSCINGQPQFKMYEPMDSAQQNQFSRDIEVLCDQFVRSVKERSINTGAVIDIAADSKVILNYDLEINTRAPYTIVNETVPKVTLIAESARPYFFLKGQTVVTVYKVPESLASYDFTNLQPSLKQEDFSSLITHVTKFLKQNAFLFYNPLNNMLIYSIIDEGRILAVEHVFICSEYLNNSLHYRFSSSQNLLLGLGDIVDGSDIKEIKTGRTGASPATVYDFISNPKYTVASLMIFTENPSVGEQIYKEAVPLANFPNKLVFRGLPVNIPQGQDLQDELLRNRASNFKTGLLRGREHRDLLLQCKVRTSFSKTQALYAVFKFLAKTKS